MTWKNPKPSPRAAAKARRLSEAKHGKPLSWFVEHRKHAPGRHNSGRPKLMPQETHIVVDNRVRVETRGLHPDAIEELKAEFSHTNPVFQKAQHMGFKSDEPAVIETWRFEYAPTTSSDPQQPQSITFPRGGMGRVRKILQRHGERFRITDQRVDGSRFMPPKPALLKSRLTMRDHQDLLIAACLKRENCLVRSPGASGKTTAMLKLIADLGLNAIVIAMRAVLLKQWRERIRDELGTEPGLVQGQTFDLRQVTLAMQQTLWRLPEERWERLCECFGVVVVDEVQHASARTFVEVVDRFPAKYRIGMSGDERRRDRKHFLAHDLFGDVVAEVARDEMIAKQITMDVEVRLVPTDFEAPWYSNAWATGRRPDYNKLLDQMTTSADRNRLVVNLIDRAQEQGPTLVFSHRVDHCKALDRVCTAAGWGCGLMLGGSEWAHEYQRTADGLMAGKLRVGLGTPQAIGTGIDIPPISREVFATPVHANEKQWRQYSWRAARTSQGKSTAVAYVLWDRKVFGRQPLVNMLRWNKRVRVLDEKKNRWVDGAEYLRAMKGDQGGSKEAERSKLDTDQLDEVERSLDAVFKRLNA